MSADTDKAQRAKALGAQRDRVSAKYVELEALVAVLSEKQWTEAKHNIMLNGPLMRAASVADRVGEAVDLLRQCQVMLDMLPAQNSLLQADDLEDVELVLTKAGNKVHHAETAIIDEEERRSVEEAKFIKRLQHEKVANAKRESEQKRATVMKVIEEEEHVKAEQREQAAREKQAAEAKLRKQAKLNEQKQELEARFESLNRSRARQQATDQGVIDGFTDSIFKSTAVEERRVQLAENRDRARSEERSRRQTSAKAFRASMRTSVRSQTLFENVRRQQQEQQEQQQPPSIPTASSSSVSSSLLSSSSLTPVPVPVVSAKDAAANLAQQEERDRQMFAELQQQLRDNYRRLTKELYSTTEIRARLTQEVQEDDDDDEFEKNDRKTAQELTKKCVAALGPSLGPSLLSTQCSCWCRHRRCDHFHNCRRCCPRRRHCCRCRHHHHRCRRSRRRCRRYDHPPTILTTTATTATTTPSSLTCSWVPPPVWLSLPFSTHRRHQPPLLVTSARQIRGRGVPRGAGGERGDGASVFPGARPQENAERTGQVTRGRRAVPPPHGGLVGI
jgi:hypothetical protein